MKLHVFLLLGVLSATLVGLLASDSLADHRDDRAGAVAGTVTKGDRPIGDALVVLEAVRDGRDIEFRTRTNHRGKFEFHGVPAGRYVISAAKRGVGRDSERIRVHPGETTRVHLDLHGDGR